MSNLGAESRELDQARAVMQPEISSGPGDCETGNLNVVSFSGISSKFAVREMERELLD
jgi:hypothetical protein